MDVLLPPLGNRPSPLQPQMPVKPERKTHVEPYEAEEDPNFSYDGFQVTRREYYAHMLEPAISFADGKLSINAVCLKKAPDVEYVQILVNREQKKLVIRPCMEDDWDSLKWCTAARKTKVITCRMFFAMIMDMIHAIRLHEIRVSQIDVAQEDGKLIVLLVMGRDTDQARTGLPGFPIRLSRLDSGPLCSLTFGQYDAMSVVLASAYRNSFPSKRRI